MNRFKTAFRKTKSGVKHILILEVDPHKTTATAAVAATTAAAPAQPELSAPEKAYVGQLFEVRVSGLNPDDTVAVEWLNRKVTVPVDSDSSGHSAMLMLGSDVKYQKAGKTGLKVRLTRNGKIETLEKAVTLYTKDFGEQRLTVAKRMVNPAKKDMERIKKESKIIGRALRTVSGSRMWTSPFKRPVPGSVSSVYGLRRIFNGQPRAPHRGLDLDASMGDPIRVCNRGRVILTGDHYFAGQSVYVDHGLGLISMYIHMSKILVQEGQMVEKGDVIGQVGKSGRVTGPHLHFGLYSLGLAVDPLPLVDKGS